MQKEYIRPYSDSERASLETNMQMDPSPLTTTPIGIKSIKSVTEIDLTPPANKKYWTCGREWREEFIYFLLVDRFHDDQERTPHPFERSTSATSLDQLGRFCGGKLSGIRKHLGYIHKLGCTALWLSPVMENNGAYENNGHHDLNSKAYHGYAIQNYLDVDPRFGTKQDLIYLVEDAHELGMRVFLDVVLNHSGDNWYYENEDSEGPYFYDRDRQYPFGDWRRLDRPRPVELRNPDYYHRRGRIRDERWHDDGIKQQYWNNRLECRNGDFYTLKDFNHDEDPDGRALQDILIKVHCYWLREADIDGFRVDAVKHMGELAIARFCSSLHDYAYRLGKCEFFLFGELTADDETADRYSEPSMSDHQTILHGLDSLLDFYLQGVLPDVILGRSDPRKLINRYEKLSYHALNREKWGQYLVTFLDNHDQTQRFAADASDEQVIAGIGYLLCALGTACIYYGTEQGLNGHGSQVECVREPLFDVAGHTMKSYLDRNCQIYQEIPKIAKIRHDIAALRFGQMHFCEVSSDGHHFALPKTQPCTLAFSRILADQEVLIAYNTSTTQKRNDSIVVDNTLPYNNGTLRFLYGKQGKIAVQKHPDLDNPSLFVQLDLEPMQFVILTNQENGCISNQEG